MRTIDALSESYQKSLELMKARVQEGDAAALDRDLLAVELGRTQAQKAAIAGRIDAAMMRLVDIVYALPYVFIVIILATLFPRGSLAALFIAIGAVGWLNMARIVRGQTLALRRREFVDAAIAGGVRTSGILWRHIVPNVIGAVIAYGTLTIPQVILFESFLSFLGLGVQEPFASLGSLINEGAQEMESSPWMLLVPAGLLMALLLAFNALCDALRARLGSGDD